MLICLESAADFKCWLEALLPIMSSVQVLCQSESQQLMLYGMDDSHTMLCHMMLRASDLPGSTISEDHHFAIHAPLIVQLLSTVPQLAERSLRWTYDASGRCTINLSGPDQVELTFQTQDSDQDMLTPEFDTSLQVHAPSTLFTSIWKDAGKTFETMRLEVIPGSNVSPGLISFLFSAPECTMARHWSVPTQVLCHEDDSCLGGDTQIVVEDDETPSTVNLFCVKMLQRVVKCAALHPRMTLYLKSDVPLALQWSITASGRQIGTAEVYLAPRYTDHEEESALSMEVSAIAI